MTCPTPHHAECAASARSCVARDVRTTSSTCGRFLSRAALGAEAAIPLSRAAPDAEAAIPDGRTPSSSATPGTAPASNVRCCRNCCRRSCEVCYGNRTVGGTKAGNT
eukprot:2754283-Prymnesium_polylepis.2